MANSKTPLKLSHLTKTYGHSRGIENVSLELEPGEVFGFLGPNGAGKTTTIRTIMNFIRPSDGEVRIFGLHSVHDSVAIKHRVGFLAGDLQMYDNLTATQYLDFVANLRGVSDDNSVKDLAKRLDVTMHQKIRTLSRGNKQKVGLVAALLHDPDLLILDEPTSGLDPLMQNQFYEIVKEHTKKGKTVFISSHILSEVQTICDRVGFMRHGKLIETVDVAKLLREAKKDVQIAMHSHTHLPKLTALAGVEVLRQDAHAIRFLTTSPPPEIITWLSKQEIHDVTIQNTSLDDMFLQLYGENHEENGHV